MITWETPFHGLSLKLAATGSGKRRFIADKVVSKCCHSAQKVSIDYRYLSQGQDMRTILTAMLFVLLSHQSFAALSDRDATELRGLHWEDAKNVELPSSKSTVTQLPGFKIVLGQEARRLREIVDGYVASEEEADAFNFRTDSEVIYEWFPVGYVKSDDWNDIRPDDLLSEMKKNDEAANKLRIKKGLPTMITTGWRQPPQLNADTHTITWSINGKNSNGQLVANFVALKLGRYGFEKFIWVIPPDRVGDRNDLLLAATDQQFGKGEHYTDYVASTDHAAEYGVAGLVAGVLGVKLLKAAGIGALILGFKKFFLLLIFPFVWGWRKIASFFRRNGTT